ncbi:MAG: exonuclease subunit SbcD [Bacteroidaceae bacterium]|nr:exonuclease subunit SbcD [Bacteroidaceae bacterium]
MKIIHTADWHIGNVFHQHERTAEHAHFLAWLLAMVRSERPDALLVVGDVFDNAQPAPKAEKLLWEFLDRLTQENPQLRIIITSGNHDSAARLEAQAALYRRIGVQVRGILPRDEGGRVLLDDLYIPIEGKDADDQAVIVAAPYLRRGDVGGNSLEEGAAQLMKDLLKGASKKWKGVPVVLMAHVFVEGVLRELCEDRKIPVIKGLVGVDMQEVALDAAYVALGHIHKPMAAEHLENVRYCGSAVPLSFGEKAYKHGVNVVEISPDGGAAVRFEEYQPLCPLLSIPQQGAARFEEVLDELKRFPLCEKGSSADGCPYVEIMVAEKTAEPAQLRALQAEADRRQVRLCRIVRVNADGTRPAYADSVEEEELCAPLNVAKLAREAYKRCFREDMPDETAQLFAEVKRECEQGPSEAAAK